MISGAESGSNAGRLSRADLISLGSVRLAQIVMDLVAENPQVQDLLSAKLPQAQGIAPEDEFPEYSDAEPFMVGNSPAMQSVFKTIRKFAGVDATVLVTGESGTGKELAARAIHERSHRAKAPFVAINCGALPPSLIASELFGHEKGSFTGAHQRKIGRIESAQDGTVFLDEIGDLPLDMQVHLLRFLQEKTIDRVGGNEPITVDARVIAATNVDLAKATQEGRLREDLFYRLNVLTLEMAPLRKRGEDIEVLSKFFCRTFAREMGQEVTGFEDEALEAILRYAWPGNIRELIARIRRAIVMAEGELVTIGDLNLPQDSEPVEGAPVTSLDEARKRAERAAIADSLRRHNQNVKKTAENLKISRPTLYRLMEEHNIRGSRGNRA